MMHFSTFLHYTQWMKVSMHSSHLWCGDLCSPLEDRVSTSIIWSTAQFTYLFSLICLSTQLFIYICIGSWIFIAYFGLYSNPALSILWISSFLAWPIGTSSVSTCVLLTYPHQCGDCLFLAFPWFLVLQLALGLSCIFPFSILESIIFPRNPGFFYWSMILMPGMFIATG